MKKYIKPSIESRTIEFGIMGNPSPENEVKINNGTSGNGGLTKELDWDEADDFGW